MKKFFLCAVLLIGIVTFISGVSRSQVILPLRSKGVWIHRIWKCGNLSSIIKQLEDSGVNWVAIKCADGRYYWPETNPGFKKWLRDQFTDFFENQEKKGIPEEQIIKEAVEKLIQAFKSKGIYVLLWQFIYGIHNGGPGTGGTPQEEADVANKILKITGIDGFIVDAQEDYEKEEPEKPDARAETFFKGIQDACHGIFLAYTVFGNPEQHKTFPYDVFGKYCDAVMPQAYWLDWEKVSWKEHGWWSKNVDSPTDAVELMYEQWENLYYKWMNPSAPHTDSIKPVFPVGSVTDNSGTIFAERGEIAEFCNAVALRAAEFSLRMAEKGYNLSTWCLSFWKYKTMTDSDRQWAWKEYAVWPPKAPIDVYLLVDLSGSFSDDLAYFKLEASILTIGLRSLYPNSRFGLGAFQDYPIYPFGSAADGDKAYYRIMDLTSDIPALLKVIMNLSTKNGLDDPQSQLVALYQAATGEGQDLSEAGYPGASIPAGQQASFRKGATKIIILWTDAPFHRPGDSGDIPYPGPGFEKTIKALLNVDPAKVIGISSGTAAVPDLREIARGTGALAPPGGVDWDSDGVVDIPEGAPLVCSVPPTGEGIADAITATVEAVAKFEYSDLTVNPTRVLPKQEVKVSVMVKNVGTSAGTDAAKLIVGGKVRDSQDVTLDPGESRELDFSFTFTKEEIGTHAVTIDGLDPIEVEVVPDTTPPPAPVINSVTHPDQDKWYKNNNPTFNWTKPDDPSGIAGYSFILDQKATTVPDTTIDTTERTKSYTDVADGTWYFHVRAVDGAGNWGPASHYKIKIRTVFPTAEITLPGDGAAIRDSVAIQGTASGDDFDHYMVEYGEGKNPSTWTLIYNSKVPVTQDTLATWDTTKISDGQYTIRLTVVDTYTYVVQVTVTVIVDNTPPVIRDVLPIEGDFVPAKPTISATLTDNLSGINENTILIKLNGNEVDASPSFDPDTGKMTWTAQTPLPDGDYDVTIDVKDKAGNEAVEAKTSFTISTKLAIRNALNYPNPCSSGTTFTYNLSQEAHVRIEIYTLAGELIKVIDPASGSVGYNGQYWDGTDDRGQELGNGVYIYRIVTQAGGKTAQEIGKLVILR